jgi:TPR repeat protein
MPFSLQFPIALVLSIVCLAVPTWADFFECHMTLHFRGDFATALREWRPLAEQGDADDQFKLGVLYDNGCGVPQDYGQARQWYKKAAAQEHAEAQFYLGRLYFNGQGVPQDFDQARHWWEKAAALRFAKAQYSLGLVYSNGRGVPEDKVQAHKWYNLAGANGSEAGANFRDRLATRMTPAQIDEAQRLAREWKPKTP